MPVIADCKSMRNNTAVYIVFNKHPNNGTIISHLISFIFVAMLPFYCSGKQCFFQLLPQLCQQFLNERLLFPAKERKTKNKNNRTKIRQTFKQYAFNILI